MVYPIHMSLVLAFASGSSWPWCLGTEKSGTNSGSSLCGLKSNLDENKKQTKTTNRGKGRGFACVFAQIRFSLCPESEFLIHVPNHCLSSIRPSAIVSPVHSELPLHCVAGAPRCHTFLEDLGLCL